MGGRGAAIFVIEPHETFVGLLGGRFGPGDRAAFFHNMVEHGVAEHVRLVNLSSEVVTPGWKLPVALLWVDGDHRYEAVRRDLECWLPFLTEEAVIVFDDAQVDGPAQVIAELTSQAWKIIDQTGKTTTLARTATLLS
jgi:hypothetical protein